GLIFLHYIRLMIIPPFELYFEPSVSDLPFFLSVLSAAIFAAGIFLIRNQKVAHWAAIWLITLMPVLGFVQIETTLDERFLYLPSVSFCLLAAGLLTQYLVHRNGSSEIPAKHVWIVAILIAIIYAPWLITREYYWQNDLALWRSAAVTS